MCRKQYRTEETKLHSRFMTRTNACIWTVLRKTELEKSFISERCAKLVKNRFRCPGKQNLGGSLTIATYQPFGSYFQRRIGEQRLLSCGKFAWGEFTRQSCLWFIWSWGQPLLNRFSFLWTLARTRICLEWHTFHYFKIKYNLNHSILCVKISEV